MSKNFDIIIVGANLTSYGLATLLGRDHNVAIISNLSRLSETPESKGLIDPVLASSLMPRTTQFEKLLNTLEVEHEAIQLTPTTIHNGKQKDFIGFGDNTPSSFDVLKYFLTSDWLRLTNTLESYFEHTFDKHNIVTLDESITKLSSVNDTEISIETKSGKNYKANKVIVTQNLKELPKIFNSDKLPKKILQKISRLKYFSILNMVFDRSDLTSDNQSAPSFYIVPSRKEKKLEFGPYIGIHQQQDRKSFWLTFPDEDLAAENENVGKILKKLKHHRNRFADKIPLGQFPKYHARMDAIGTSSNQLDLDPAISIGPISIVSGELSSLPYLEGESEAIMTYLSQNEGAQIDYQTPDLTNNVSENLLTSP